MNTLPALVPHVSLLDIAYNDALASLLVFKYQGGFVYLPGGEKFEYLLAEFGVRVPSGELKLNDSLDPSRTRVDYGKRYTPEA